MCPQKQCLSGKEDGLSGRTNQRLPPGGSSRRSRVRESALRYNQYKSKVARAPSVTLRVPPSSRRKAMFPPDSTSKRCNTLYLACKTCKKGQRNFTFSVLFAVGANCVRPRAFTERPYEDDFLSVGKTCFMEGTPCRPFAGGDHRASAVGESEPTPHPPRCFGWAGQARHQAALRGLQPLQSSVFLLACSLHRASRPLISTQQKRTAFAVLLAGGDRSASAKGV